MEEEGDGRARRVACICIRSRPAGRSKRFRKPEEHFCSIDFIRGSPLHSAPQIATFKSRVSFVRIHRMPRAGHPAATRIASTSNTGATFSIASKNPRFLITTQQQGFIRERDSTTEHDRSYPAARSKKYIYTSRYPLRDFPSFSMETSALQPLLVAGCVNNRNELLQGLRLPYTNREGSDGQAR